MLIGRAEGCGIRITDHYVSAEHASVYWQDGEWRLRDLASTNGTFVDGRALAVGETVALRVGQVLAFGGSEQAPRWILLDDSPPQPRGVSLDGVEPRVGSSEMLALPDEEAPELVISTEGSRWVGERGEDGALIPVADQDVIELASGSWRLELPPPTEVVTNEKTVERDADLRNIEALRLRFRASPGSQHVDVLAELGPERTRLAPRAYHQLLLRLARARRQDAESGVSPQEQGWLYADRVAEELSISRAKLNVDIFRARKQIADLGVRGAARGIERRPQTQQLRLGVPELVFEEP